VVLVDTSVWIEVMRRRPRARLEDYVHFDDVVTCLPVIQEVLQGIDRDDYFDVARQALWALPAVESPLRPEVIEDAIGLYRRARRAGLTVRAGADCVIAACAIRHGLEVLHADRDFDVLARVSDLRTRNIFER
jgi:predicted nucleic acid-binding protein